MSEKTLCPNSKDIIYQHIDGEVILLNLKNGNYFSLDNIGVLVWESVVRSIPCRVLADVLRSVLLNDTEKILSSINQLYKDLQDEGLACNCEQPSKEIRKYILSWIHALNNGQCRHVPAVLNSYKNIQEKYAHPCGIKEN